MTYSKSTLTDSVKFGLSSTKQIFAKSSLSLIRIHSGKKNFFYLQLLLNLIAVHRQNSSILYRSRVSSDHTRSANTSFASESGSAMAPQTQNLMKDEMLDQEVEKISKDNVTMMKPDEYWAFIETQRKKQSSPSQQSIKSSIASYNFDDIGLPCSTPIPTDDEDDEPTSDDLLMQSAFVSQIDQSQALNTKELDTSSSSVDLDLTLVEFLKTPMVVEVMNNPFSDPNMPKLVRIPSGDLYEHVEESSTGDEKTMEEIEDSTCGDDQELQQASSLLSDDDTELNTTPEANAYAALQQTNSTDVFFEKLQNDDFFDGVPGFLPSYQPDIHSPDDSSDESSSSSECSEDDDSVKSMKLMNGSIEDPSVFPDITEDEQTKADETLNTTKATQMLSPGELIRSMPVDDDFFLMDFASVIRDPADKVATQKILSGDIDVFLAEVFSPIHFWFHCGNALDKLEEELQKDYEKLVPLQLSISDCNLKPELLVACYLTLYKIWHRALIVEPLNSENELRLLFIDYGTVAMVHKKYVKFLFKKYLSTPRLAFRGRFLNLKPPMRQRMWDEREVEKFLVKFSNKKLKGTVVRYDTAEEAYELDLSYTSKRETVNCREWILEHAVAVSFELTPNSIYPQCYYFPSFPTLEKSHPSFHELSMMNISGVNYNLLVETNNFSTLSDSMLMRTPKLLSMIGLKQFARQKEYFFPTRR